MTNTLAIIILSIASIFIIYMFACYIMYQKRIKSAIIVNFDRVLVNIDHIIKRGEIYVKNNPSKSIGDYIGAHILEQNINPEGIKEVLDLQKNFYNLIFVSIRHESLRRETAKVLNDWGIKGELYMNENSFDYDDLFDYVFFTKKNQGIDIIKTIGFNEPNLGLKSEERSA